MGLIRNHKRSAQAHEKQFDELCLWIDAHIEEPIGWQQMMAQSGLDSQTNSVYRTPQRCLPMARQLAGVR